MKMNNGRLQFFNLVKAMREAQREYFSTRSHEALQKARSLERSVDAYIKRGDDYLKKQNQEPTLFDNRSRGSRQIQNITGVHTQTTLPLQAYP